MAAEIAAIRDVPVTAEYTLPTCLVNREVVQTKEVGGIGHRRTWPRLPLASTPDDEALLN